MEAVEELRSFYNSRLQQLRSARDHAQSHINTLSSKDESKSGRVALLTGFSLEAVVAKALNVANANYDEQNHNGESEMKAALESLMARVKVAEGIGEQCERVLPQNTKEQENKN